MSTFAPVSLTNLTLLSGNKLMKVLIAERVVSMRRKKLNNILLGLINQKVEKVLLQEIFLMTTK